MNIWIWFFCGLLSLVVSAFVVYWLVKDEDEFLTREPFTVGDATKAVLAILLGIAAGPITAIFAVIVLIGALLDSNKVLWTPNKEKDSE